MKPLFDGIIAKYTGSALATYCTGGLHREHAPQKTAMPFAVFHLISGRPADAFRERIETFTVQFNIYSETATAAQLDDLYSKLTALYDYAELTVTGYTFVVMRRTLQTSFYDIENENWQYSIQYEIEMQRN